MVTLRDVTDADLPTLFEHQRDPESVRMTRVPARDAAAFAEHRAAIRADPEVVWLAIDEDGELVGDVVSFVHDGQREVGYRLGRGHWGRGIATAALTALLAALPERPLYATVAEDNPASRRVLEKCGFVLAGDDVGRGGLRLVLSG
jgi:RimJ/RimL family protein N-acetyltransferase